MLQNNTFDFEASNKLYRELQRQSIPMTIVTRWAAYATKLPLTPGLKDTVTERPYHSYFRAVKTNQKFSQNSAKIARIFQKF